MDMNRYEITRQFKTCKNAFISIHLEYDESLYACYNEEIGHKQLCPFAKNDTCQSRELPDHAEDNLSKLLFI